MTIVPYTADKKKEWNQHIQGADNGHFMFQRDFMEYHANRFKDCSVMIYDKNKLRAVLPCNLIKQDAYSHQGLTFGGLVLSPKVYGAEVIEIWQALIEYLKNEGIQTLTTKVQPCVFHSSAREDEGYALWRLGAQLIRRDLSTIVDLSLPSKYRSTKKQNIKKGRLANLQLRKTQDLVGFWSLLETVLNQQHGAKPTHSLEEIRLLIERFPQNIQLHGAYASGGEDMLAGALLFINHKTVHTQYLAVGNEGRDCGALDFLLDGLITQQRDLGFRYFSFGISTENQGQVLNEGLLFQKEGFGGKSRTYDFYHLAL